MRLKACLALLATSIFSCWGASASAETGKPSWYLYYGDYGSQGDAQVDSAAFVSAGIPASVFQGERDKRWHVIVAKSGSKSDIESILPKVKSAVPRNPSFGYHIISCACRIKVAQPPSLSSSSAPFNVKVWKNGSEMAYTDGMSPGDFLAMQMSSKTGCFAIRHVATEMLVPSGGSGSFNVRDSSGMSCKTMYIVHLD